MKKPIRLTIVFLLLSISPVLAIQERSITGLGAEKKVRAELIMPEGKGPFPGILVLHTNNGIKKYDIAYAQELAKKGYACLIPHYFEPYSITYDTHNWATAAYSENILNDFEAEVQYLKKQPFIKKGRIGAVGFSMGGYWALILAAKSAVRAAVSYYGELAGGGLGSGEFKYRFINTFSKTSSPVLILHGEDDMAVNVKYAQQLADMLKAKACTYVLKTYPGAGQRFDRGASLHVSAAKDSWSRTLDFLKKYLKDQTAGGK